MKTIQQRGIINILLPLMLVMLFAFAGPTQIMAINTDGDELSNINDYNDGMLDVNEKSIVENCSTETLFYTSGSNVDVIAYNPLTGIEQVYIRDSGGDTINGNALITDTERGYLYSVDSIDSSKLKVYDPSVGTWENLGTISGADLNSGGGAFHNGVLYIGDAGHQLYTVTLSSNGKSIVSSNLWSTNPLGTVTSNWGDMAVATGENGNSTLFISMRNMIYTIDL